MSVFVNGDYSKSYAKHQLWRLRLTNNAQIAKIAAFKHIAYLYDIDFWSEHLNIYAPIDARVPPEAFNYFADFLASDGVKIEYVIHMNDIGEIVERQSIMPKISRSSSKLNDFAYDTYHTLEEIHSWIDQMTSTYPDMVTPFTVGKSYENRDVRGFKISSSKTAAKHDGTKVAAKKAVWWDGCIHSREWISSATVIYIAYSLLSKYGHDSDITHLVDQFDYYILPVFNVDGYAYTWTTDRLWRKTRSPTSNASCYGVDPNRNWDYHWCENGASQDPCSDSFCGDKAFSEIEVAQVAKFIMDRQDTIVHYINFHAFSQLGMSAWAYTATPPPHFKLQDDGSIQAVNALRAVHGTQYHHDSIAQIIYVASGSSIDWTYGALNITFSYGVELRDTGTFGFLLPADQIIPTGEETLAALSALLRYIEKHVYASAKRSHRQGIFQTNGNLTTAHYLDKYIQQMDVKYIGGDVPWTLPFGDHFNSSSYASFTDTNKTNFSNASDLEIIARRYEFEPLYSVSENQIQTKPPICNTNTQWMNSGVLFADKTIEPYVTGIHQTGFLNIFTKQNAVNQEKFICIDFSDDHGHTFCYLCSINQHHHEPTRPRDQSKRRKLIPYDNPKALRTRSASLDRIPQNPSRLDSIPYRFIVRTGTRKNSGTRAQIFLYMYGTERNWTSVNLHARAKGSPDGFPTGSVRTFCLRGPDIGQLHYLNVNLVGARSDKEWFLKEIEITNLDTSVSWLCEFNCWLPKKPDEENGPIKSTVQPKRKSPTRQPDIPIDSLSVYILQVRTGGKPFAGTDSNIQVTIRGSTSQTQKLALTSARANLFEQNQVDTFAIVGWDIGDLAEITVESDKSQLAADWDLQEMAMWKIVPNADNNHSMVYFPFNTWLGKSKSKLKAKRETYPSTDHHINGPICYHIVVKTGKDFGAGTDANVFIIIYGKSGRTCVHLLDNKLKNDFEANRTSEFTIMDIDVGKIDRIKVWHDNSGVGAAWLLDSIVVRKKYSTCRSIADIFVQRLETISHALYRKTFEQVKKDYALRLSSTKENASRSSDRRSAKSRDYDDLASSRGILRSPIVNDKGNLNKKVTWDEQSLGSQDDPFSINTKRMRNMQQTIEKSRRTSASPPQMESGHFEHTAYWISSHSYDDKKWHITSIEELNQLDLDQSTRNALLVDRAAANPKIKTPINEKDDDVYEFEAKSWLKKDKDNSKPEVILTPKSVQLSTTTKKSSTEMKSDLQKRPSSSLSKTSSDHRPDKPIERDSKLSSQFDLGPLERSPRGLGSLDRQLRDISKTQFDDSQRTDKKHVSAPKREEESFSDKYHRSPSSPHSNTSIKIPSANERELLSKASNESAHRSRSAISSLINTPLSTLPTQPLKSPRSSKEPISNRDLSDRMPTESTSKVVARTTVERPSHKTTRSQVYSSAYGTTPADDF
ncbi:unnamed protein product [Rotaria socialis]|uniref:Uncharacterized protein n=3 Tax=Rotaria socialis TaxID=392032 RepID=A0A819WKU6_9BILA|nr:unnamed protein product [Rotaria socialis]